MATEKFKMPSDKKIWQEVDAELAAYPEAFRKINRVPARLDVFDKKKKWYLDEPKRHEEAANELEKVAQAKAIQIAADKTYLSLRKKHGKSIITAKIFKAQYPNVKLDGLAKLTKRKLHEAYDFAGLMAEASVIRQKVQRISALSRKYLYAYLTQTYGLYLKILRSGVADATFNDIQALLWNQYKIKTHHDTPKSSLLLKMIFEGTSDKTIHLYSRAFQLAAGYEVEEADFTDFIKQIGGMEKIRKAYATVFAADAGQLQTVYEKDAEYSASLNELRSKEPFTVVQLGSGQGASFRNDMFGYYCLVVAHVDSLNQLELYGQFPADASIANQLIQRISNVSRSADRPSWLAHKTKSSTASANRLKAKLISKCEKEQMKKEAKAAAAKKKAAAEKRIAKQRAALKSSSKTSAKTKK